MAFFGWRPARLLAALAAVIGVLAASAQAEPRRIVAVGDLHGDYAAYRAIIEEAGLVNARGKWTGGDAVFVQLGDVPDRGPDTRKIIAHLMKLEKAAKKKGGAVVALIGNHEAMNMTGDLRYVTAEEFAAFRTGKSKRLRDRYFADRKDELRARYGGVLDDAAVRAKFDSEVPLGYLEHRLAWSADGEIGEWILGHDAIVKFDGALFVHGGVSAAYAARPIDETNAAIRDALAGNGDAAILTDEAGPLWHRGNAEETPEGAASVDAALAAMGAQRLVIGHTPSIEGIRALYGGKVIMADTGISAAYGGVRSWLEFDNGGVIAHNNGVATVIDGDAGQP